MSISSVSANQYMRAYQAPKPIVNTTTNSDANKTGTAEVNTNNANPPDNSQSATVTGRPTSAASSSYATITNSVDGQPSSSSVKGQGYGAYSSAMNNRVVYTGNPSQNGNHPISPELTGVIKDVLNGAGEEVLGKLPIGPGISRSDGMPSHATPQGSQATDHNSSTDTSSSNVISDASENSPFGPISNDPKADANMSLQQIMDKKGKTIDSMLKDGLISQDTADEMHKRLDTVKDESDRISKNNGGKIPDDQMGRLKSELLVKGNWEQSHPNLTRLEKVEDKIKEDVYNKLKDGTISQDEAQKVFDNIRKSRNDIYADEKINGGFITRGQEEHLTAQLNEYNNASKTSSGDAKPMKLGEMMNKQKDAIDFMLKNGAISRSAADEMKGKLTDIEAQARKMAEKNGGRLSADQVKSLRGELTSNAEWERQHPRLAELNHIMDQQKQAVADGLKNGTITQAQAKTMMDSIHDFHGMINDRVKENGGFITKDQKNSFIAGLNSIAGVTLTAST